MGIFGNSDLPGQWLPNAFARPLAYRDCTVVPNEIGAFQPDATNITGPLRLHEGQRR